MTSSLDIISNSILFKDLPQKQLEDIRNISMEKSYNRGEIIFSEGDKADGFYISARGRVKIYKVSLDGKEQILHIFGPGEPFGEVPVFTGQRFPANAETLEKSSILFFPRDKFVELISANPSLALSMLAVLSKRLRQFTVQIENLSLKEVPARLAAYLLLLAKEQNQTGQVELTISKGQLASLLGTIPETLSRIFSKMTSQKLIDVDTRSIKLLDIQGLKDLSEQGRIE